MTREEATWRLADHFRVHNDGVHTPKLDEAVTIMFKALQESERKHGRWIKYGYKWKCSECDGKINIDGTPEENGLYYCPNCGADMRGK